MRGLAYWVHRLMEGSPVLTRPIAVQIRVDPLCGARLLAGPRAASPKKRVRFPRAALLGRLAPWGAAGCKPVPLGARGFDSLDDQRRCSSLVERWPFKPRGQGSIPCGGNCRCSQAARQEASTLSARVRFPPPALAVPSEGGWPLKPAHSVRPREPLCGAFGKDAGL